LVGSLFKQNYLRPYDYKSELSPVSNPGIIEASPSCSSKGIGHSFKVTRGLHTFYNIFQSMPSASMEITNIASMDITNIAIKSSSMEDDRCLRLRHLSSTVSDRALDEGLKRALEKTCNIESPAKKKQMKKESWAFSEPANIIMPPPLTSEPSTSMATSCLGGLTEDNRRAKIANMLREATEMAEAVGKIDPEPESRPNGRQQFHRRNSFVIHRNRKSTGIIQAPVVPSTTKIVSTQWKHT
jgi:hypothetical protein